MTEEHVKRSMLSHEILLAQAASMHLFGDEGQARGIDASTQIDVISQKNIRIVFETEIAKAPYELSRAASVSALNQSHAGDSKVLLTADMYFRDGMFLGGDITLTLGPPDGRSLDADLGQLTIVDVFEID